MQNLIDKYNLVPHPEGGYYAVVYESKQTVTSPVVNKNRKALTHIYFLLLKGQVSLFHKVTHDEIRHPPPIGRARHRGGRGTGDDDGDPVARVRGRDLR